MKCTVAPKSAALLALCASLAVVSACTFTSEKDGAGGANGSGSEMLKGHVSYALVESAVLTPSCNQCHGNSGAGGVSLKSYAAAAPNAARIEKAVFTDKSMPKNSSLTAYQAAVLKAWIDEGAPVNVGGAVAPVSAPVAAIKVEDLNFANVNAKIFKPLCVKCHGQDGGVDLRNFDSIKASIGKIGVAVLAQGSMPPIAPFMTPDTNALLSAWIYAGAPETAPGTDVQPNYNSIYANVFQPLCMNCHSTGRLGRKHPLAPYAKLLDTTTEHAVVAGDLAQSELLDVITRPAGDEAIMPPSSTGLAPLSPAIVEVIKQWILNGAPEGDGTPSPIASSSPNPIASPAS